MEDEKNLVLKIWGQGRGVLISYYDYQNLTAFFILAFDPIDGF